MFPVSRRLALSASRVARHNRVRLSGSLQPLPVASEPAMSIHRQNFSTKISSNPVNPARAKANRAHSGSAMAMEMPPQTATAVQMEALNLREEIGDDLDPVHVSVESIAEKFALDKPVLSAEQVKTFERDGYVVCSGFFDRAETKHLQRYVDEIMSWQETPFKWMQYFETGVNDSNDRLVCRVEDFLDYHSEIARLLVPPILKGVSDILGGGQQAVLYKEKINYKLAGGGPFPAHQDSPAYVAFQEKPGAQYHITAMVSIDNSDITNGALEFVKGAHDPMVILPHSAKGVIADEYLEQYDKDGAWELEPTNAGDVVFFHSYAPHRSGSNSSDRNRRAMFITCNDADQGNRRRDYYDLKRKMFPPDIERIEGKDYSEGAKVFNVATPIK